jgi:hypothetical protein
MSVILFTKNYATVIQLFQEDIPPSTCKICPVIQLACVERKNAAVFAMSSVVPILFKGCGSALASFFVRCLTKEAANAPITCSFGSFIL